MSGGSDPAGGSASATFDAGAVATCPMPRGVPQLPPTAACSTSARPAPAQARGQYFSASPKTARIMSMLSQVASMEVTVTRTEVEALLLENQLIKSLKPRYNVMLRDDKSYPYVLLTDQEWPRLGFHRGPRSIPGRYFGPYPNAGVVRETLNLMHKLFRLRSCEDSVFRNRSRPCLQYQIGRCSAPCGAVSRED